MSMYRSLTSTRTSIGNRTITQVVLAVAVIALCSDRADAQSPSYTDFHSGPVTPALPAGAPGSWDERIHEKVAILEEDGMFKMWYTGHPATGQIASNIGYATSLDGVTWTRHPSNPIIDRGITQQNISVLKIADGEYWMYVEVENRRIELLTSVDGLTWIPDPVNPILSDASGPVVWREGSDWFMLYENRLGTLPSIHLARSTDGKAWTDAPGNPVIREGEYSQPDSIVKDGSTYHLYYHIGDGHARYASSQDLVTWGNRQRVVSGFQSQFTYRTSAGEIRSYVVTIDERRLDLRYGRTAQFPLVWSFDEGSGAVASGTPGGGMYADLLNGTAWSTGVGATGISFDGVDDYARTDFRQNLNAWTVTAFVRGETAPTAASSSGPVQRQSNFQIGWDHPDPLFRGAAAVAIGSNWYSASFGPLAAQTWYHLAATYDGETLRAYTNGVLVTENTRPSGPPALEALPLVFGKNSSRDTFFRGAIDEVRVYDHALTGAEIQTLAQVDDVPPPAPPSNVAAMAVGESVALSWTPPAGAPPAGYRVYRGLSGATRAFLAQVSGSLSGYTDIGTASNTTYDYHVTTVAGLGVESTASAVVTATTGNVAPAAPTGLSATNAPGEVRLDWADNGEGDLATYRVYRSSTAGGPYAQLAAISPPISAHSDTTITSGTYYYVVSAVDAAGQESPHSNEVSGAPSTTVPGVAGRWHFSEGTGTVANDSSGHDRHGSLVNGPAWITGVLGGGLQFDGVNDYVSVPFPANLTSWTVSVWVRSGAAPANAQASGPVQRDASLQINWNHQDAGFRGAAALRVGSNWYAASFGSLGADTWYHLAATYDGETLRAYRNGVLITSNTQPSGPPAADTQPLTLGRHPTRDQFFAGSIDEAEIYDHVLSAAEIVDLANVAADSTPPGQSSLSGSVVGQNAELSWTQASDPESGVAAYRLMRGTASGGGKTLVAQLAAPTATYLDSQTAPNTVYYYEVRAVNGAGVVGPASAEVALVTGDTAPPAPTGVTATAAGTQIVVGWSSSPVLDVAGYRVHRRSGTGTYSPITPVLAGNSYIDTDVVQGVTYFYIVTTVDLSGLQSGASVEASATLSTSEPGLIARWELNDGSGAAAHDSAGTHDGSLLNGPTWAAGMIGGALSFDGVNDSVTTTFTQHVPLWTIAAWVRSPNAPSAAQASGPVQREANFQINWNHAEPNFRGAAAVRVGGNWYAARFGTLAPDTWYHLAATYDGDVLRVYRDGVLVGSNAQPTGPADADAGPVYLAKHATRDRFFAGTVDDVRIYDRALDAAAITALAGVR